MKGLRVFDIVTSTFGLLLLSPLLVLIGVLIKLDSPGPVFYGALRVGQFGKLFTLYKFRSMYTGADELGPAITTADDKRITHVG